MNESTPHSLIPHSLLHALPIYSFAIHSFTHSHMSAIRTRTLEEYHADYQYSVDDPDGFWAAAAEPFTWRKKWDTVRGGEFSPAGTSTWYAGATLNLTENCLDRHLEQRANKLAIIFEPNDPKTRHLRLTYRELHEQVCQFANVLKKLGRLMEPK
jgi:acetyl-CoA synthetase